MTDRLAAELAAIAEREKAAAPGPWRRDGLRIILPDDYRCNELDDFDDADLAFIASARADVPRLLAAVEAALAFHADAGDGCASCLDGYGERIEWPCDEYAAISAALLGEDTGHDHRPACC